MLNNPILEIRKSNHQQLSQLSVADQKLIKSVIKRLSVIKVNSLQAQVIQQELIGMAQEHQMRGGSLTKELGEDPSTFAKALYKSSSAMNGLELMLNFMVRLSGYFFAWLLLGSLFLYGGLTWQASPFIYLFYGAVASVSYLVEVLLTPLFIFKHPHLPQWVSLVSLVTIGALFMHFLGPMNQESIDVSLILIGSGVFFLVFKGLQLRFLKHLVQLEA